MVATNYPVLPRTIDAGEELLQASHWSAAEPPHLTRDAIIDYATPINASSLA